MFKKRVLWNLSIKLFVVQFRWRPQELSLDICRRDLSQLPGLPASSGLQITVLFWRMETDRLWGVVTEYPGLCWSGLRGKSSDQKCCHGVSRNIIWFALCWKARRKEERSHILLGIRILPLHLRCRLSGPSLCHRSGADTTCLQDSPNTTFASLQPDVSSESPSPLGTSTWRSQENSNPTPDLLSPVRPSSCILLGKQMICPLSHCALTCMSALSPQYRLKWSPDPSPGPAGSPLRPSNPFSTQHSKGCSNIQKETWEFPASNTSNFWLS